MTGDPSWWNQIRETVGQGVSEVGKRVSIQSLARSVSGWFRVDEAEVQEILRQVRAELPTTEALLVGKPQSGKSSIVRSLTGVSAEIVGQGFRPHTQYTQQYSYPTQELPLLVFTDTVGLGDGMQETSDVIRELIGELQPDQTRAKVLILTVKISDFATDTLKQIASQIRAKHPEVPCLLAVTCLHELYPAEVSDHPDYPPSFSDVDRAFSTIQQNFAGLFDRAVLIDFTLEEDEFHPPFYGLEAFIEALSELLPEAEARTIAQLLNEQDAGKQIGEIYRDAGRRYILPFSVMAGAAAAIPLPWADMPVITALQVSMVGALGQLYGQTLTPSQAGGVVSAIAGGFVAQAIGRELIKFVPGFGSVIAASWASAYTWALGEAACVYFGDLLGGKTPDPQRIQAAMKESFQLAKERFKKT
ncbi:50S ribosome-binding GTPase [Cyanobacteria bacterium FACHB-63]|nr:50S ribosome-binding GTPase [Cyanobacteria bacterium FACHB-63]